MKRTILLLLLVMSLTAVGYAKQSSTTQIVQTQESNDIIVLKNATRIDAIIVEVDDNVIRYRKASNPNGPLFSQRTSEIASVIYANGEVQTFSAASSNNEQNQTLQNDYLNNANNADVQENNKKQKAKLQFNPQPSDHYVVGITLGYMQKQNIAHDSEEGTEKSSFLLGKKGATSPAMQLGLTINPTFKYGIGLRTGLFMEYAAEKNATTIELNKYPYEKDVTYKAYDISLSLPLQISYRYEIWNKISVMFYTGPVFAFGAYQMLKSEDEKSKNIYTYDIYAEEKIKYRGFNALWGIGAGFQWDRLRLDMGGEFGMMKKNKQSYNGWEFYQKWNRPFYITLTCFF